MKDKKIQEPKPFLKWAGGKTQLLNTFENFYPNILKNGQCEKYIEPFLGGGAVFFSIYNKYNIKSAFLCDINPDIVIAYKVIQKYVNELIEQLFELSEQYYSLKEENRKDFYYTIRVQYNQLKKELNYNIISEKWIDSTSLLIFLNKTCFNGLFRTNKKGEFNVPHGRYKKPKILDSDNLYAVSKALEIAEIELADFESSLEKITNNCFVYFDPPYRPLNKTSSFTSYSPFEFNDKQQKRLANFYKYLDKNYSLKLMLSNSDPKNNDHNDLFFDNIYQEFNINRVLAKRMINSKANKRGNIYELVITNY